MMNKLIFLLLIAVNFMVGQMLQLPKNIQSPNAASLGKYGDIPMNYYTGRANVNIPLYSLNEGGIPLDISLSYDTGGVRVNDVPGWVGQNWTLNAGGVITRTVKGHSNDEYYYKKNGERYGYLRHSSLLNDTNWNDVNKLKILAYNSLLGSPNFSDLEPDIFTFNFMGHTGKFFYGQDGEWKISSDSNLKIEILESDFIQPLGYNYIGSQINDDLPWSKVIGKISITDEFGNKYIFGKNANDIEYCFSNFFNQALVEGRDLTKNGTPSLYSNAWYLSEVVDRLGRIIYSFNYERGDNQAYFHKGSFSATVQNSSCLDGTNSIGENLLKGSLIKPCFLKSITSLSGVTIDLTSTNHNALKYSKQTEGLINWFTGAYWYNKYFNQNGTTAEYNDFKSFFWYSSHLTDGKTPDQDYIVGYNLTFYALENLFNKLFWRKLNYISIYYQPDKNNSLNKTTLKTINFSYSETINNSKSRLRLDNVLIDNTLNYKFEYDRFELLPTSFIENMDDYGYFSLSSLPDAERMKYGNLKKITYPTGGFSEFEYEPHKYVKYVNFNKDSYTNENKIVSGLRVKSISDVSGNGNVEKREFIYKNAINSTTENGVLLYLVNKRIVINDKSLQGSDFTIYFDSSNNLINQSNFSGTHIEYPTVIERKLNNGYVLHKYTSYDEYKDVIPTNKSLSASYSMFDQKTDRGFFRGKLIEKSIFKENDTTPLIQELYTYEMKENQKARGLSSMPYTGCVRDIGGGGIYRQEFLFGNAYEIYYSDFKLKEKITKNYFPTGTIEERTNYNYFSRENFGDTFLRTTEVTDTHGKKRKEELTYTFDKTVEPFTTLTNRREFAVVENKKYLDTNLLQTTKTDYKNFVISSKNYLFPEKVWEAKGTNTSELKLTIDTYDANGNVLKAHMENGNYINYMYAYNNQYPILKYEGEETFGSNVSTQTFAMQTSFLKTEAEKNVLDFAKIKTIQNTLSSAYPTHQFTFYTFQPNVGVRSITYPNGVMEIYEYDGMGRLSAIKDLDGKVLKQLYYELKK